MRDGAALSGIFHGVVIGVLVIGLPSSVDPPTQTVIPIEMILLEEEEPEPEPEPEQMAEEVAPEPEPPEQEAKAVPEPVAPEPEPEPEPVPPPEAKPEPEPEKLAKPPPPKPKRRPDIRVAMPDKNKKHEQPKPDQLTTILRNVEKLRDQPNRRREPMAKAQIRGAATLSASALEQNEMARAIQDQLRNCWRIDPGARGAEDIVVEIKVLLNQDGSVQRVEIVDVVRMVQDGFFRSAAENAKRAISRCSPFRLPLRKYDIWRQLTLRFDPRQMFGT
ncbi:MAG: cell envelope integrity protein TolA [Proteobacteria bacterium]|nr:cell envelope integrity protein TolA [Pseudomonadota bacterium]